MSNSNGEGSKSKVLASKIRLYRNLDKTPFVHRLSDESRKSVAKKIFASLQNSKLAGEFDMLELPALSEYDKLSLVQSGVITPDEARESGYSAVLISKDKSTSILLCSKEHIKICVTGEGQMLGELYKKADFIDNIFIDSLVIAFDKKLGFLTASPMYLGTGMISSLVMSLPELKTNGAIPSLSRTLSKLGFTIKPLFDENGDIFEITNNISLGITEEAQLENLNGVCNLILQS